MSSCLNDFPNSKRVQTVDSVNSALDNVSSILHLTSSAAASVIPWAFFEESMTPIQMYQIIHQYK